MFAVCIYFICGRRPKYDLFILPPVSTSAVLTILRSNKRENSKEKNDCPSHIKCFRVIFYLYRCRLAASRNEVFSIIVSSPTVEGAAPKTSCSISCPSSRAE